MTDEGRKVARIAPALNDSAEFACGFDPLPEDEGRPQDKHDIQNDAGPSQNAERRVEQKNEADEACDGHRDVTEDLLGLHEPLAPFGPKGEGLRQLYHKAKAEAGATGKRIAKSRESRKKQREDREPRLDVRPEDADIFVADFRLWLSVFRRWLIPTC